MRYDPYRQVQPDELTAIAHRRLIATIDTVDHLCALMDLHNTEDKVCVSVKNYNKLALFLKHIQNPCDVRNSGTMYFSENSAQNTPKLCPYRHFSLPVHVSPNCGETETDTLYDRPRFVAFSHHADRMRVACAECYDGSGPSHTSFRFGATT